MNNHGLRTIKIIGILAVLILICRGVAAYEKGPVELSDDVDKWYREALVYYQKGRYEEAQSRLDAIIKAVESDTMLQLWRDNTRARPNLEDVKQLSSDVAAHLAVDPAQSVVPATEEALIEHAEAQLEAERQQAMVQAQEEFARRLRETELSEQKLQQEHEQARVRQEEEQARLAAQQAREQEAALARQRSEQERVAREAELAQLREEQEARRQALRAQKEERNRQRLEELARIKAEKEERHRMLLAEREEERAKKIEERQRILDERKAQQTIALQERQSRQEEARLAAEQLKQQEALRLASLEQQRQAEAEESARQKATEQARLAEEQARRQELARQQAAEQARAEEQRLAQLETERRAKEEEQARLVEAQARRQELARQQAAEQARMAEEKKREEAAVRQARLAEEHARQQEQLRFAKLEAASQAQAVKKNNPVPAGDPAMSIDDEVHLLEMAVSRMKRQEKVSGKDPQKAVIRIEDMSKEIYYQKMLDEQRMRQMFVEQRQEEQDRLAAQQARQQESEQARLAAQHTREQERMEQSRLREEARLAHEHAVETERRSREEARLAVINRQEEIRQVRLSQQEQRRIELERLREDRRLQKEQERQERSAAYAAEVQTAESQQQALRETQREEESVLRAREKKHVEDAAKIRKIDRLWGESRRLYRLGMFEEAIKGFKEVIRLEGNPRIKYTPEAKRLITEAEQKIIERDLEQEKLKVQQDVHRSEAEMTQAVLDRQVVPYVDPPATLVEQDEDSLIEPPVIRKKLAVKKVTMDFDKVGLRSVMRFLSQESGVNFIASQKVLNMDPVVTARFSEATLLEVIKYITKSLGLVHRIDKDVIWIADPEEIANEEMETRVYYLRKGGGLFTEFTPVSGGGDTGLGGSSASINQIYTIEDTLKQMVPWPGDAKLTYDKRLNALIVRNTPQNLQMMEDIIYNLDIEPCQILIEARFVEVELTDTDDLGFEWTLTDDFAIDKKGGAFKWGLKDASGIDFTSFSRAAEGLNLSFAGVLTEPQFEMIIHALEESKKVKTLSSPRITTMNNQMASIKVVDEWIYPTRYEFEVVQSDINGDGDFSDAGETVYKNVPKDFLRRDVGILLKVIPAVGADRETISLSLIPEVSEATADFFSFTGDVSLPKFTSRNLATSVVVRSSDTVVLGGLISESSTKTETKVPILSSIPVVGNLFKKNAESKIRKNLLIFVTAKVLNSSGEEIVVRKK